MFKCWEREGAPGEVGLQVLLAGLYEHTYLCGKDLPVEGLGWGSAENWSRNNVSRDRRVLLLDHWLSSNLSIRPFLAYPARKKSLILRLAEL